MENMIADINYKRVIPRDLFNESKLLKCLGRLCMLIGDELTPVKMSFTIPAAFEIGRFDDGYLTITNIEITVKETVCTFKTAINSKRNWPLFMEFENTEYHVFNDDGSFDDEFIEFVKFSKL